MNNLRGAKIIYQESKATQPSHLYFLQKDENYCEAIVTSESGAKRKLNIDLSNYYTKNEVDVKFLDYYTKNEVDTALATKLDKGNSQQLSLSSIFRINQDGNANKVDITDGVLFSQTLDKTWNVSALVTTLPDNDYRYVYAKASKTTSVASIYLSKNQIQFDSDVNDYYFLVGILHPVEDGVRVLSITIGTTTISGGLVRTGIISSLDGKTSFNLNTGEITGKIIFRDGNGDLQDVADAISYVEYSFDKINWHSNVWVTDIWMRQKIGKNGVWSEPFLIKGMDAINITVWSENGNVFINGDVSTTLVATVFKGAEDITDSIDSNRFNWIRQSSNPDSDSVWNSLHKAKGKFIDITDEDISRSANFLVEIDIPEELLF